VEEAGRWAVAELEPVPKNSCIGEIYLAGPFKTIGMPKTAKVEKTKRAVANESGKYRLGIDR
jgi:hypothetical protein